MPNELVFDGTITYENNEYKCRDKTFPTLENALIFVSYQADLMRARNCKPVNTLVYLNPDGTFDCQWDKCPYEPEEIQEKLDSMELKTPNGKLWSGMVLLFVYHYPHNLQTPFFTKLYIPSTVAETISMIL